MVTDSNPGKRHEQAPFGPYSTFQECVEDNQDKEDPEGFCAWLEQELSE